MLPNILQLNENEINVVVATFYDMIAFAFNTQVIQKQLPKILKSESNLQNLFSSKDSEHKPYLLSSKKQSKDFEKSK